MAKQSEWINIFDETADRLATQLVQDAFRHSGTYGEATSYIKQLNQQAYGVVSNRETNASMKINDAICELAIHKIYEEERSLPIKHEED